MLLTIHCTKKERDKITTLLRKLKKIDKRPYQHIIVEALTNLIKIKGDSNERPTNQI